MEFLLPNQILTRGIAVPLPCPLDESGHFDARSQERLLNRVSNEGAHAVFSGPGVEQGLLEDPELRRQVNEACHFSVAGPVHWAGVSALHVADLCANLEAAVKLGASMAVVDPLAVRDVSDPQALFHRHLGPLFERLGKGIPVMLEGRLRTQELKRLARLDFVRGVSVNAGPKVAANYLKGARHYKARHEFGVFLENGTSIFSLFRPGPAGPMGAIRDRLQRLWMGGELPHGVTPLSANLFPRTWRMAWSAAVAGDVERLDACRRGLAGLEFPFDALACVKAALVEEKVFTSDLALPGGKRLDKAERREWLARYHAVKEKLGALENAPAPAPAVKRTAAASMPRAGTFDIAGFGGVNADEFRFVDRILGAESKGMVRGELRRAAGGVILNQVSWASMLGASTTLFGYTGDDEEGDFLRQSLERLGTDHSHLLRKDGHTGRAIIFVDPKGGRAIYMEAGINGEITAPDLAPFSGYLGSARLLSTEISQLKLGVVLGLLKMAKKAGIPSAVDLDIPPSQVLAKGGLGTLEQLTAALKGADYLKTSVEFARELLPKAPEKELAGRLHGLLGKKKGFWVALSAAERGCQISDGGVTLRIPACPGARVLDTTGAGDAFMAGLLVGTRLNLGLADLGHLANATGAAAVTFLGGTPPGPGARAAVLKFYRGKAPLKLEAGPRPGGTSTGDGPAFMRRALADLKKLASRHGADSLQEARELIQKAEATGKRLHVTGVGKPEYVAAYTASSYSSTGTPAFFLHATEAGHGASGQVSRGDVVIAISNSGETAELKSAVLTVKKNGAKLIGVSGKTGSWLARHSDVFLFAGVEHEGDGMNLAPRASVLAEILVLAALGVELQRDKKFSAEDFRNFHPGGSLGRKQP